MRTFFRQLRPAVTMLVFATLVCGVLYPLAVTGIGRIAFADQVEGSLIRENGVIVGSSLLGQPFSATTYFHSRPSAADAGYGGLGSSGSNFGPQNEDFLNLVAVRAAEYRVTNGLSAAALVPVDAVTASGSGLDSMISVANARLQAPRVAEARGLPIADVRSIIDAATTSRPLGFLGDNGVVVLTANRALDRLAPVVAPAQGLGG